jgi:hypothetical protein
MILVDLDLTAIAVSTHADPFTLKTSNTRNSRKRNWLIAGQEGP